MVYLSIVKTEQKKPSEHSADRSQRRARVMQRVRRAKISTVVGAVVLLVIAIFLIANWPQQPSQQPDRSQPASTPQYQTVLPSGKTIKDLGGWKKLSPPKGSSFYAYQDEVDGVRVNVSQQQLPKDFQSNTNQKVAELAKAYNATTQLTIDSGTTAYIGLSAKGPQSVIFTKDNLLVFIQSEKKLPNNEWKRYISSLGIPNTTDNAEY